MFDHGYQLVDIFAVVELIRIEEKKQLFLKTFKIGGRISKGFDLVKKVARERAVANRLMLILNIWKINDLLFDIIEVTTLALRLVNFLNIVQEFKQVNLHILRV